MFAFGSLRMWRNYFLLLLGLTVIGATQFISRSALTTSGEPLSHESTIVADYEAQWDGWDDQRSVRIVGVLEIILKAIYPASVPANAGFCVTAAAHVKKIDCELASPTPSALSSSVAHSSQENAAMEAAYEERIQRFFDSKPLLFHLHLAGATIAPSEAQRPAHDSVTWSVLAARDNISSFNGSIELSLPAELTRIGNFSFRNRAAPVFVAVKDPIFTLPNILRWAGSFLGSLLTLPGILYFVQDYKKRKIRRRQRAGKPNDEVDRDAPQTQPGHLHSKTSGTGKKAASSDRRSAEIPSSPRPAPRNRD